MIVPVVVESGRVEKAFDIYSRLLRDRIIMLTTEIDDDLASVVIAQLLFLQLENPKKDISMYLMSPGGSVYSTMAIYDTMQNISCDVATYCMGYAMSGGAVLLAAGAPGKRFALPNSRVMLHQPWGGAIGDAKQIEIAAKEMNKTKEQIYSVLSHHTGRTIPQLRIDCDRDFFLSPQEAKEYGIVDKIIPFCPKRKKGG